jgi:transcription elongation factor GreA
LGTNSTDKKESIIMPEKQIILTAEGLKKIEQKLDHSIGTSSGSRGKKSSRPSSSAISAKTPSTRTPRTSGVHRGEILTLEKMLRNAKLNR